VFNVCLCFQAEISATVETQLMKMLSHSAVMLDTEDIPSQMKAWAAAGYALDQLPPGLQDLQARTRASIPALLTSPSLCRSKQV